MTVNSFKLLGLGVIVIKLFCVEFTFKNKDFSLSLTFVIKAKNLPTRVVPKGAPLHEYVRLGFEIGRRK